MARKPLWPESDPSGVGFAELLGLLPVYEADLLVGLHWRIRFAALETCCLFLRDLHISKTRAVLHQISPLPTESAAHHY